MRVIVIRDRREVKATRVKDKMPVLFNKMFKSMGESDPEVELSLRTDKGKELVRVGKVHNEVLAFLTLSNLQILYEHSDRAMELSKQLESIKDEKDEIEE